MLLRLYSIVPGEDGTDERLRIETRHHAHGRVLEHRSTERELTDDRTVAETGRPLAAFCRAHHYADPAGELAAIADAADEPS